MFSHTTDSHFLCPAFTWPILTVIWNFGDKRELVNFSAPRHRKPLWLMTCQDITSLWNVELGALSDAYIVAFFVVTSLSCCRWLPSRCLVDQIKTSPGVTFWHTVVCGHWHHGVTWSNKTLHMTQNTLWQRGPYFCRTTYSFHILPYFVISCYAGVLFVVLFCFFARHVAMNW